MPVQGAGRSPAACSSGYFPGSSRPAGFQDEEAPALPQPRRGPRGSEPKASVPGTACSPDTLSLVSPELAAWTSDAPARPPCCAWAGSALRLTSRHPTRKGLRVRDNGASLTARRLFGER